MATSAIFFQKPNNISRLFQLSTTGNNRDKPFISLQI